MYAADMISPRSGNGSTLWAVALLAAFLLASAATTSGQPAGNPYEPQLSRVKSSIEQAGYRVLGVGRAMNAGFFGGAEVPVWWVDTAANYARPSNEAASRQAMTSIGAMYDVLSSEGASTIFSAGQTWTKYNIITQARRGDVTTLLNALRNAGSDDEKRAAFAAFHSNVRFRVYDLEKQQWVDQQDFVNKNFGAPAPPGPPPAPPNPSPPPPAPPTPAPTPAAPAPPAAPSLKTLALVAESATSVGPGEHVLFRIGVSLSGPPSGPLDITLGWRSADGAFQYGRFMTITPSSVDFQVPGICLKVVAKRGSPPPNPGAAPYVRFEVHSAVRIGSQALISQPPVVVEARGNAAIPVTPVPTPARTPPQSSCSVVLSTE
jgi:hypothetical protein